MTHPTAARNSLGWVVQQYTHDSGWTAIPGEPYATRGEAQAFVNANVAAGNPLRVYEAIDHPAVGIA